MQCIKQRFVIEPENILFAGLCIHFSAQKFLQVGAVKGLKAQTSETLV